MKQELEQAVSRLLEQDMSQVDFAGSPPEYDANDEHWAGEFKKDWDAGGVFSRGRWYSFTSLGDALTGWTSEMEVELSRGFLQAVRMRFIHDPSALATIDHLLSYS